MQTLPLMMFFLKQKLRCGKTVCYLVPLYVCDFLLSESDVNCEVVLIVSSLKALTEGQMDGIRKYGFSCLKLIL